MPDLRVSIGGDPEGGWLAEIHDGHAVKTLRPEGKDLGAALVCALDGWLPQPDRTELDNLTKQHDADVKALAAAGTEIAALTKRANDAEAALVKAQAPASTADTKKSDTKDA